MTLHRPLLAVPRASVDVDRRRGVAALGTAPARSITTIALDERHDRADPAALIRALPAGEPVLCWVRDGAGLVGWGEVARATFTGPASLDQADEWWSTLSARMHADDQVGLPGTGPIAFVSGAFDPRTAQTVVVVPAVVLGRSAGRDWITSYDGAQPSLPAGPEPAGPRIVSYADGALTPDEWRGAVAEAVRRIRAGELGKVVLARDVIATTPERIDVRFLLTELARRYTTCWTYSVDGLVGATPELLVSLHGRQIRARVLAGTVRPGEEETLRQSAKEQSEHRFAARSAAELLAPYCSDLRVPAEPLLLRLPNVSHLATPIEGTASTGASALALAARMHPTAAVCGTPTGAARDLIAELEHLDRGRYAGPVGWVDAAGDGEFGVALRCAEIGADSVRLIAGCGIVDGSDPDAELAESLAKMVVMRDALEAGGARSG